jgi:hypothetical protein
VDESLVVTDALRLTLLLRQKGGLRFERALLRYHARFVEARPGLSVDESLVVLALLGELRDWRAPAAARALSQLLSEEEGSDVLLRRRRLGRAPSMGDAA